MPLIEAAATVKSACISTAPVFDTSQEGAPKKHDDGWWALKIHNKGGAQPSGSVLQSLMWVMWLGAAAATWFVPTDEYLKFFVAVCALVLSTIAMPDDGSSVLPYYLHIIIPIIAFKSAMFGGHWSFSLFYFIFIFVPIADFIVGVDVANQTKTEQKLLHKSFSFKLHTLLVPVCVLGMLVAGGYFVSQGNLTTLEFIGFSLSAGFYTGAIGIVVGHELCHKASWLERMLGRFLLCAVCYGHFYVEHTLGHHKDVATEKDAATARYGENFYAFLPRVVYGEFRSACELEVKRLRKKNLGWWRNEIPMYFGFSGFLAWLLYRSFGTLALQFFFVQAVWAVILFESVNYLEHYGLERRQNADGTHETVKPQHSWDSPAKLTNIILIKLQRHADHHAHAGKRYQTLQAYDESPQLPSGYATMIMLAFFPPIWRMVMHPRLMKFRATQVGQKWRHGPTPKYREKNE